MFGDGPGDDVVPRNKRRFRVLYQGCTIPEPPPDYAHLRQVLHQLEDRLAQLQESGRGNGHSARYLQEEITKLRERLQ